MNKTKFKKKHEQHTKKFISELNSINTNKLIPFRFSDEIWIFGKYKGKKISETPIQYIKWALSNMNLSDTSISILKNYVK